VLRDGLPRSVPSSEVLQGDVVLLTAGSMVPGDGVVLDSKDFFVNEAVPTGETSALALHGADVGISVSTAVDVARDAADFGLLEKDLGILREGIDEGRMTFANTLKHILSTISANLGNMFSMAVAMVVRTRRPFYRSRPGNLLLGSTLVMIAVALALPYLPFGTIFGFVPLPAPLLLAMIALTLLHMLAVEIAKRRFYRHVAAIRARA
jgi:magnesium-transporting ATPase (P-type)